MAAPHALPARDGALRRPQGRFTTGLFRDGALRCDYKLYLPPGHAGQALPLVVMLHACTQDPDDFADGTGMNAAADEGGFVVLYPSQTRCANASRCWNWFLDAHQRRDTGEPALIAALTRDVMQRHGIDRRRVYVAGLSAGGSMAAIVGDAYPDLFAAVGVHSGLPAGSASDLHSALAAMTSGAEAMPIRPGAPPVIVFHGDHDGLVHPRNGAHIGASRAGVAVALTEADDGGLPYTRRIYRDERRRVVAEHWEIHGAGHAWSGGRESSRFADAAGPDATREMLRFFLARTLRR